MVYKPFVSFCHQIRHKTKLNLTIKNGYSSVEKKDIESHFKSLDLHIFVFLNLNRYNHGWYN